eukprot:gene25274-biopygen7479
MCAGTHAFARERYSKRSPWEPPRVQRGGGVPWAGRGMPLRASPPPLSHPCADRRRRDAAVRAGHMSRARGAAVGRAGRGGPVRASPAPVRAKSHWWRRRARAGEQPGERDLSRTIRLPVAVSACFCVQVSLSAAVRCLILGVQR